MKFAAVVGDRPRAAYPDPLDAPQPHLSEPKRCSDQPSHLSLQHRGGQGGMRRSAGATVKQGVKGLHGRFRRELSHLARDSFRCFFRNSQPPFG